MAARVGRAGGLSLSLSETGGERELCHPEVMRVGLNACASVGAIHGVGGGSGGGVRRRRAAGAVGCHPEVVRPAKAAARWQLWQ